MMAISSTIWARCGQHLGKLGAALAVPGELEPRPEHGRVRADERISLTGDDRRRQRFAFELRECGLGVEKIKLAGCPGHEQVDHPFGLGGEVGDSRRQRVSRGRADLRGGRAERARPRTRRSAGRPGRSCRRRCRTRGRNSGGSGVRVERIVVIHGSALGNGLVEIEEHACQNRPGRARSHRHRPRRVRRSCWRRAP